MPENGADNRKLGRKELSDQQSGRHALRYIKRQILDGVFPC
jgi:hypothetical protein